MGRASVRGRRGLAEEMAKTAAAAAVTVHESAARRWAAAAGGRRLEAGAEGTERGGRRGPAVFDLRCGRFRPAGAEGRVVKVGGGGGGGRRQRRSMSARGAG